MRMKRSKMIPLLKELKISLKIRVWIASGQNFQESTPGGIPLSDR